jgi:hypothetical protein
VDGYRLGADERQYLAQRQYLALYFFGGAKAAPVKLRGKAAPVKLLKLDPGSAHRRRAMEGLRTATVTHGRKREHPPAAIRMLHPAMRTRPRARGDWAVRVSGDGARRGRPAAPAHLTIPATDQSPAKAPPGGFIDGEHFTLSAS